MMKKMMTIKEEVTKRDPSGFLDDIPLTMLMPQYVEDTDCDELYFITKHAHLLRYFKQFNVPLPTKKVDGHMVIGCYTLTRLKVIVHYTYMFALLNKNTRRDVKELGFFARRNGKGNMVDYRTLMYFCK